jgi:LuxR family maltose regulon positive regulatory protein
VDRDLNSGRDRRAVVGVVERPRLSALLDAHLPQLCVLRAASGAGKTTLLRSWAVSRIDPAPLLWVTISSEVASPAAFWTRLVETARRIGGVSDETSAALSAQVARSEDPVRVAIDFLREAGPAVFVLDAYEKVGDAIGQVDADLLRLTAELPQVRVIVAARGRTGLTDDGLRIRDQVQVIGDEQLAFTGDEVAELVRVHLDRDDLRLAGSIVRATRGYALAVRALLLAMANRGSIPAVDSEEWRQLVATDLRAALPDEAAARFVAVTSVPPYFDAVLATHLTGHADVEDVLAGLERQGFGRWIPYAREHPVFQYVDSIRDAFSAELRHSSERDYSRSAGVAARWLISCGDHETAFDLALEARDYQLATQVYVDLLRVNPECYLTDRLVYPLGSLPVRVLKTYPMLAFALGLARWTHPVLRASAPEAMSIAANTRSRTEIVSPDVDGFINESVRAVSLRLLARFADAARVSRAAIAELDTLPDERRDQFCEVIAMILRQLSYNQLQGGDYGEALATMTRSASVTKVASTRNCALAYITGTHAYLGDLPAARATRTQIDPHGWPLEAELSYLNAMTVVGEGLLDLDALDFQTGLERITSAESFTDTTEFWSFFTLVALHAQIALGHGLAAARHLEARLSVPLPPHGMGDNTSTYTLLNLQAIGWLAGGRAAKADRIVAGAPERAPEFVPARILHLILTDRSAVAMERLSGWLALPRHTIRTRGTSLALGAAAALRCGQERTALSLARRAQHLHAPHGVHAHLVFLPASDRQSLAELAARHSDHATATYLTAVTADVMPTVARRVVLSEQERVVLTELAATHSRAQIAAQLTVSPNTVKSQLASIYRKLGVSNRAGALAAAAEYELFEDTTATASRPAGRT